MPFKYAMVQNVLLAEWFVSNSNCFADCIISPLSFLKYKTKTKKIGIDLLYKEI